MRHSFLVYGLSCNLRLSLASHQLSSPATPFPPRSLRSGPLSCSSARRKVNYYRRRRKHHNSPERIFCSQSHGLHRQWSSSHRSAIIPPDPVPLAIQSAFPFRVLVLSPANPSVVADLARVPVPSLVLVLVHGDSTLAIRVHVHVHILLLLFPLQLPLQLPFPLPLLHASLPALDNLLSADHTARRRTHIPRYRQDLEESFSRAPAVGLGKRIAAVIVLVLAGGLVSVIRPVPVTLGLSLEVVNVARMFCE
ncbi:hypothetical protein C8F01DRAFT_1266571 [Mycena amicta]|nr:hypothetical protein C8F01DRAFT_1266571 [Mycena amicta]